MKSNYLILIFATAMLLALATLMGCSDRRPAKQGPPGRDGQSCQTTTLSNGVEIVCPGQDPVFVYNGRNGAGCSVTSEINGAEITCAGKTVSIHNGLDATPVEALQFCSSEGAPSYGNFPEYALCVGGQLLGVFWDGSNAWLAALAPGAYRSTATGLVCNFTIGQDCKITQTP